MNVIKWSRQFGASAVGYWCFSVAATSAVVVLISTNAWVSQDAFISFRYAELFHAGYGLVFNAGDRVQGFTHPLWMLLLLAGPIEHISVYTMVLGVVLSGLVCLVGACLHSASPQRVFGLMSLLVVFSPAAALLNGAREGWRIRSATCSLL